jgi:hypothetical protein
MGSVVCGLLMKYKPHDPKRINIKSLCRLRSSSASAERACPPAGVESLPR